MIQCVCKHIKEVQIHYTQHSFFILQLHQFNTAYYQNVALLCFFLNGNAIAQKVFQITVLAKCV